jgi:transcriptional regulator with XRE-family HTH domain
MYGEFLRSVREARGLSQRALAEVAGIPQPNVSAIERDRRLPTADTLNRWLVACGFELAAVAGDRIVHCGLPDGGWFPDEGPSAPLEGDPVAAPPVVGPQTSLARRREVIDAVLTLAADQVQRRP